MPLPAILQPLPLFLDLNGNGLSGGKVYIGVAGSDPQTSPVQCYWDAANTIPASQPFATQSGYFSNAGNVAQLYAPTSYSIRVRDANDAVVYYQATVVNALAGPIALGANGLTVGTTQLVCSGGFVGFGTASPGSAADVAGTLRVTNPAVSTQYYSFAVTAGTMTVTPSAGVTAIKHQADLHVIWNAAGSSQYGVWNSSGLQAYGGIFDSIGDVRGVPQTALSGNFTLSNSQKGAKLKLTNTGAQTVTVPTNAAVSFTTDTIITLINRGTTAASVTPSGGVTLIQAGTGLTGSRTLAVNGIATLLKNDTDEWMITGTGVS